MVWHRHTSLRHFTYPPKWMLVTDSDPRVRQHSSYHPPVDPLSVTVRSLWPLHVPGIPPTQCSIHIVASILLSTSKDLSVRCVLSSLTLNAVLELNFVQCPCNSSVIASLKSYSFIHSFIHSNRQFLKAKHCFILAWVIETVWSRSFKNSIADGFTGSNTFKVIRWNI